MSFGQATLESTKQYKKTISFAILCSLFIALVNATKGTDGDLAWYTDSFMRAYNVGFFEYWATSGKWGMPITDIGYVFFSWTLSNLTGHNAAIFVFVHTMISYVLLNLSIINWGKCLNVKSFSVASAILLACFYPYIFTRSAHILRQFMAMGFLAYAVSLIPFSNSVMDYLKKYWWILMVMFSFHKSSLIFAILIGLWYLKDDYANHRRNYFMILLAIVGYQIIARILLPFVGDADGIAKVVERASQDTTYELEGLKIYEYGTIVIMGLISIFNAKRPDIDRNLRHSLNIVVILSFFIITNFYQLELARRFYYYLLVFLPFVYLIVCKRLNINKPNQIIISLSLITAFILYLEFGFWKYNIPNGVLFDPVFNYLFNTNGLYY